MRDDKTFTVDGAIERWYGLPIKGPVTLTNVHSRKECDGRPCIIHNPSDHHMRDWPLIWREDRGIMERICPHGIGHIDPDCLAYQISIGHSGAGTHGCDLCCIPPERKSDA